MITFINPGSLDLRAIKVVGLTSKSGEDTIGRFGTGFKYALAVVARLGGTVSIWAENEWHKIGTREENFRGESFLQMTINDEDLPFAASLGRDWEAWMAFREFYSNALDEGGNVHRFETRPEPEDDQIIIAVEWDAFEAIFFSMEEHFIGGDEKPVWETAGLQVFPGRSSFVFYKGIAITKLEEPAAQRYNITSYIDLTEDRTAKYSWQVMSRIQTYLVECTDEEICMRAVDARNTFESKLDFSACSDVSPTFLGAAASLEHSANETAVALVRKQLPADPELVSIGTTADTSDPAEKTLHSALKRIRKIGGNTTSATFILARGQTIVGDYTVKDKNIFISERVFDDLDRMTKAAILGLDEVSGGQWVIGMIMNACKENAGEALF